MRAIPFSLLLALASAAAAAPGDLDSTFGTNGSAYLRIGQSRDSIRQVLPLPDGKVLAVGSSGSLSMARYLADGTLDPSFGKGGRVLHGGYVGVIQAILQPDGRILVAGWRVSGSATYIPQIARYLANGSPDSSFTSNPLGQPGMTPVMALQPDGRVVYALRSTSQSAMRPFRLMPDGTPDTAFNDVSASAASMQGYPTGVLIQPDGQIVVTGHIDTTPFTSGFIARRFSGTGIHDASFGTSPNPGGQSITSALQADGKIIVAGCSSDANQRIAILRLLPTGGVDFGFSGDGYTTITSNDVLCAKGIAVRPDGRIAIAASPTGIESDGLHVYQLLPDGSPDASFAAGHAHFLRGTRSSANDAALQADGKLLVGGNLWGRDYALARVNTDGTADFTFAGTGIALTDFLGGRSATARAVRRSGDKLVVLAHLSDVSLYGEPALGEVGLVRVGPDGAADVTFGSEGQAFASLSTNPLGESFGAQAEALAVQADGKILVAGFGIVDGAGSATVARFNANGSLDTAFGSTGRRAIAPGARWDAAAQAVEVMADGRIVVAGLLTPAQCCTSGSRYDVFAARLFPDGTFDATFGNAGIVRLPTNDAVGSSHGSVRVLLQPDGKIVLTGMQWKGLGTVRLTTQGQLDSPFGTAGAVDPSLPPNLTSGRPAAIVRKANGDLTLAGSGGAGTLCSSAYADTYTLFAWMNAAGAVDASLPPEGRLAGRLRSSVALNSALLDEQERIVAAGSRHAACEPGNFPELLQSARRPLVARFTRSGALDLAFGDAGWAELPIGSSATSVAGVDALRLDDGRIVALTSELGLHRLAGGGASTPAGPVADIDNDSIPNGVDAAEGRDPFVRDNDIFNSARLFAMQQFRDFLGREGDSGGVQYWEGQLSSGSQGPAQAIESFFGSAEFQGVGAPVARLYYAYFLRIPDFSGLTYWISQFRAGNSLDAISNQFATSPEFVNRYGSLDNAAFVDRVYRNILGRPPDSAGLAFWQAQLDGGMTRGQLMVQFSESPEYRSLIGNEVYVTMIYVGMLRREPDAGGFSFWVGQLDAGNSPLALIEAFLGSQEYRNRFLP